MADHRKARPVSGEIMTAAALRETARRPSAHDADDIVDADYEVVPSPDAVARPHHPRFALQDRAAGMDMLCHASVMPDLSGRPIRGGPLFWLLGIALAVGAFWASGGHFLARQAGWLDARAAGSQISIAGLTSRMEQGAAGPILLVEAEAVNGGSDATVLPPLEIHVTGNEGRTTRYKLGTSGAVLAAGDRFAFSSRLDMPKNGVKTVSVTFRE